MNRRDILTTAAAVVLLNSLYSTANARARPRAVDEWLRRLVELKNALRSGEMSVTDWQREVEAQNYTAPVQDVVQWLDADAAISHFHHATRLADYADPVLPPEVIGAEGTEHWFLRAFGMRRGGGLLPHVHNNMVSAHLVISGEFRVRTHDRVSDMGDAVILRARRDEVIAPGAIITMSDLSENQHWLTATQDRSMTLDIAVLDLPASWPYGRRAEHFSTILVDPTPPPERDGSIIAPVLTLEESVRKFAS